MSVVATTRLLESPIGFNQGSSSLRARAMRAARGSAAVLAIAVLALFGCKGDEQAAAQTADATMVAAAATPKAHASQELTRPEAKRLLAKHGGFPMIAGTDTFSIGDGVWCENPPKLFGNLQSYIQRGLVTLTPGQESVGDNRCRDAHGYHFDVELTPFGKKYVANQVNGMVDVRTCLEDLGEVTGVASEPGGASATVEYTLVQHPTPFGDGRCKGSRTESAGFRRYDDGWRIVQ